MRIDAGTVAAPLVREIYRETLRVGANPRSRIDIDGTDVIALQESSDENDDVPPSQWSKLKLLLPGVKPLPSLPVLSA